VRGAVAVFGREVFERRLLAALALGLGLLPLGVIWLPELRTENPVEVRNGLALTLALGLGAALAILLGGSVISRDLGEKRLAFYFSRPLRGWAIWAGKLAAVVVLALGSALLAALPTALLHGRLPGLGGVLAGLDPGTTWTLLAFLVLALTLLSHVFSIILRARSLWLVLDLTGTSLFALLAHEAVHRLGLVGAFTPRWQAALTLAGFALAGFLVAGAVQVIAGRTDPARSHRALSITLGAVLLAGALGVQGFARWTLAGTPRDLAPIQQVVPSGGAWIALLGTDPRRRFTSAFLTDLRTGRFVRALPLWNQDQGWMDVGFTPDARWAAWLEPMEGAARDGALQLSRLDLGRPDASPLRSNVLYPRLPTNWALSPDGSRVAAIQDGRLVVDEIATGSRLAAVPVPRLEGLSPLQFASPGLVRLRGARRNLDGPVVWEIWGLDVGRGRLRQTGGFESRPTAARWSSDGSRIVKLDPRERTIELLDGWTARPLAVVPWGEPTPRMARFLADGRIAVEASGEGGAELRIFSPDLAREWSRRRVPGASRLWVVGQPAPDLLTVAVPSPDRSRKEGLLLLDLAAGTARALPGDLEPVPSWGLEPESGGSRLFLSRRGHLFELDPRTAALRRVLGPEERR
jgi:hypothetical protein